MRFGFGWKAVSGIFMCLTTNLDRGFLRSAEEQLYN
jgi:hypothetical protein